MNIRKDPIYISREVSRALWLLSKVENQEYYQITPDEITDTIMREQIKDRWPQLLEHQKEVDKLEKTLIESLRTK